MCYFLATSIPKGESIPTPVAFAFAACNPLVSVLLSHGWEWRTFVSASKMTCRKRTFLLLSVVRAKIHYMFSVAKYVH